MLQTVAAHEWDVQGENCMRACMCSFKTSKSSFSDKYPKHYLPNYRTMYSFSVEAFEGVDPKRALTTVYIRVLDSNDNSPTFENTPYDFSVIENAPAGTLVGVVTASDADGGATNEVSVIVSACFYHEVVLPGEGYSSLHSV